MSDVKRVGGGGGSNGWDTVDHSGSGTEVFAHSGTSDMSKLPRTPSTWGLSTVSSNVLWFRPGAKALIWDRGVGANIGFAVEDLNSDVQPATIEIFPQAAYSGAGTWLRGGSVNIFGAQGTIGDGSDSGWVWLKSFSSVGLLLKPIADTEPTAGTMELQSCRRTTWGAPVDTTTTVFEEIWETTTTATTANQVLASWQIGSASTGYATKVVVNIIKRIGTTNTESCVLSQTYHSNGTVHSEVNAAGGIISDKAPSAGVSFSPRINLTTPSTGVLEVQVTPASATSTRWGVVVTVMRLG